MGRGDKGREWWGMEWYVGKEVWCHVVCGEIYVGGCWGRNRAVEASMLDGMRECVGKVSAECTVYGDREWCAMLYWGGLKSC